MEDNNKGFKIIIGILLVILIVIIGIIVGNVFMKDKTNNNLDNNANINDVDDNKDNNNDNNNDNSGSGKEDEEVPWGVEDDVSTENVEYKGSQYIISYPYYTGVRQRSGYVAEQGDGTMVLADGQRADSLVPNSVNDVLPLWFEQEVKNMSGYYDLKCKDYKFELQSQKEMIINGKNMAKFEGVFNYSTYKNESKSHKWVAYATKTEKNGAYALWMVFDISEDQSKGALIEEHAYNMAKSFREE